MFTSPDPERAEGIVTSTTPLLVAGRRAAGPVQGRARALVDGSGRVGQTGRVFHDTLLDENAASHIGLGSGFPHLANDPADCDVKRVNSSAVHTDFTIGGPDVDVTGTTREGREIAVLIRGEWAL